MLFPALHLFKRRNPGIGVVQPCDEAERDLAILLMVEKTTAICFIERPALGVNDAARNMFIRFDIP